MGSNDGRQLKTEDHPAAAAAAAAENEADVEAFLYAMVLLGGSALPMVLKAAIELDVLEIIAGSGPDAQLSAAQVAAELPTSNPAAAAMLDRMFRHLASYSVLTCSLRRHPDGGAERLYGLAPVCKFLTRNPQGVSLAPLSIFGQDEVCMKCWYHLKDAVLEGSVPFYKANDMTPFEGVNPRFKRVINEAMSNHSTILINKILEKYNGFDNLNSLVDVGGGTGATLNMIVSKHPQIKGTNFDLPHVIEDAPSYPGVEHVGGDMFISIPKGDAIFMKWMCHDWSDEQCLKLLHNCYKAVPENGKVIMVEGIIPEYPSPDPMTMSIGISDMFMLAHHSGGKERTKRELEGLAQGAGFSGIRLECPAYNTWVMEIYKI